MGVGKQRGRDRVLSGQTTLWLCLCSILTKPIIKMLFNRRLHVTHTHTNTHQEKLKQDVVSQHGAECLP